jgi:hypothetical protein
LSILLVILGVLIIVFVQVDVLATVLHPEIESPISSRFQRLTRRVLAVIERAVPHRDRSQIILNWSLPLMVAGLIGLWLLLLSVGFACIYYPWIGNEAIFASPNQLDPTFLNALYYSGVTQSTVGYGDIQPITWPVQLVSVTQSTLGALAVAFGVAYVLAVYPAISHKRTVATALDAEIAGQANAVPMVRRYLTEQHEWNDDLADRLRELGLEILAITEAHETHPVLYYSHPRHVQHSFLRILVVVQNLIGLLRYGLSPDRHAHLVHNPQLLLLEQSLHYSLRRLTTSLHIPPLPERDETAERRRLAGEYQIVCDELSHLGLTPACVLASEPVPVLVDSDLALEGTATDPHDTFTYEGKPAIFDPALDLSSEAAVEAYVTFRLETDPYLEAYAQASGYPIEEARANYETTWWIGGR